MEVVHCHQADLSPILTMQGKCIFDTTGKFFWVDTIFILVSFFTNFSHFISFAFFIK